MKFSRGLKVAAAAAVLAGATLTGAHADPADHRYIVGGNQAASPWIVQLEFNTYGQRGTFGCTGEQLNEEWVLTAKHCTENSYNMKAYQSNSRVDPGEAITADRTYDGPVGDIALVHLSQESPLPSYADLDFSYEPQVGDRGDIYGYGLGANRTPVTTLRTAAVSVIGSSYDAYGGDAVHLRGVSGAANHGDSGGPLIINGKVVAVCSTGDDSDPGANTRAQSNYALLSQSADWIEQTTGIDFDGGVANDTDIDDPAEAPVADAPETFPVDEAADVVEPAAAIDNDSDNGDDWDIWSDWDSWGSWIIWNDWNSWSHSWSWSSSWSSSYAETVA